MAQGPLFTAAPIPLANYPEEENRRKKKQQVNRNERREADPNHGAVSAGGGIFRSVPKFTVAIAQVSLSLGKSGAAGA